MHGIKLGPVGVNAPVAKAEQREVVQQLEALCQCVGYTEELVSTLLDRITPVMREEVATGPSADGCSSQTMGSPLARDLQNVTSNMGWLNMRIRNALDRLQL